MISSRPFSARRLLAAAVTAGVALVASGCGGGGIDAGAAAIVGDRRISVADVQTATTQVNQIIDPQGTNADQRFDQRTVLSLLIVEPFVVEAAAGAGVGVSADQARSLFADYKFTDPRTGSTTPDAPSVDLVRTIVAMNVLQGVPPAPGGKALPVEQGTVVLGRAVEKLKASRISVNPRYGTFEPVYDPQARKIFPMTPSSPDWLVKEPTPTQTAEPGQTP